MCFGGMSDGDYRQIYVSLILTLKITTVACMPTKVMCYTPQASQCTTITGCVATSIFAGALRDNSIYGRATAWPSTLIARLSGRGLTKSWAANSHKSSFKSDGSCKTLHPRSIIGEKADAENSVASSVGDRFSKILCVDSVFTIINDAGLIGPS